MNALDYIESVSEKLPAADERERDSVKTLICFVTDHRLMYAGVGRMDAVLRCFNVFLCQAIRYVTSEVVKVIFKFNNSTAYLYFFINIVKTYFTIY